MQKRIQKEYAIKAQKRRRVAQLKQRQRDAAAQLRQLDEEIKRDHQRPIPVEMTYIITAAERVYAPHEEIPMAPPGMITLVIRPMFGDGRVVRNFIPPTAPIPPAPPLMRTVVIKGTDVWYVSYVPWD